jgi:hypothetical protein
MILFFTFQGFFRKSRRNLEANLKHFNRKNMLEIRKASEADKSEVWHIIKSVISTGDTYYFYPNSSPEKMHA